VQKDSVEVPTRKDEPSVPLENFTLMTDDVIVWNYNKRVLDATAVRVGMNSHMTHPRTFWYQVIRSGPFLGTSGILV
jgi:hypothetical protein